MALRRIYLDHAASTPVDPAALEAMARVLAEVPGNPSSPHLEGRAAKDVLEEARSRVAAVLGTRPREVIFTSGGTEALQIALRGAARARRARSNRVVRSAVEHPAVTEAADALATEGFDVVVPPVGADGRVEAGSFLDAVGPAAAVAALMLAHHETGAIQPVAEVGRALRERGIPLLCDAALGPGRLALRPDDLVVDLLALAGHKFGAPKGIGVLYVRRKTPMERWLTGGIQEERLRPGTENVAGAVALATALERATTERAARAARYDDLARRVLAGLASTDGWKRLGPAEATLPGLVTLEIPGVEGEAAMINLDLEGIAVSTGSTCALGSSDPSPGLLAMGLTAKRAASTIRISVGEDVTEADADRAAEVLGRVVGRLRSLAGR